MLTVSFPLVGCAQVLELQSMPKVVTLVGGGYIGMEFAGMFARLVCEVHVIARQQLPLAPRFDKEVRAVVPVAIVQQSLFVCYS
jgi:glutathione reductase (NADPH)